MKAFATFALLAVAACAVDIDAEVPSFFNPDASKNNTETDHTVEVNVWTTIDNELMELMTEVSDLITSVT